MTISKNKKERKMNRKQLEVLLNDQLEQYTLEEFFEQFDLTPLDVVEVVYDAGQMDDEILEGMTPSDS